VERNNLTTDKHRTRREFPARAQSARDAGEVVDIGSTRVRFLIRSSETAGAFSLIECPSPPRTLVSPVHRHTWEDEYSFVLAGRVAALLGDEVVYAESGDLIVKPRRQWHTIWNPGDEPCRILETISPGGFEHFFDELAARIDQATSQSAPRGDLGSRYGVDTDFESVRTLCSEHHLKSPLPTAPRKLDGQRGR
jgi:mannose-6-phosphate isomerase-like protein (cupin superfamily)